ncbi:threonyl-tRNA synthetase [Elusimicrobium posterum]|uniref:hypothetical protein n=1 Tax=Elusimicrobium posterum TaxID=3116653 RepID=UPI003C72AD03
MANIDLQTSRHSLSHILAQAVQELYPGTHLGIGPAIDNGFYYDFESEHKFTPEDLKTISEKMKEIIKARQPFECKILSKEEARKMFADKGETFKLELIDALEDGTISVYTNGSFVDLCKGPTLNIQAKLTILNLPT